MNEALLFYVVLWVALPLCVVAIAMTLAQPVIEWWTRRKPTPWRDRLELDALGTLILILVIIFGVAYLMSQGG